MPENILDKELTNEEEKNKKTKSSSKKPLKSKNTAGIKNDHKLK